MEHAVHLGAEKFVKGVSPTAGSAILRKVRHIFKTIGQCETVDIDQLDAGLKECEDIMEADEDDGKYGEDSEDDNNFDTGDACGKALALVKQVR